MPETIERELQRLKDDFYGLKEQVPDVDGLFGGPVDRDFPLDLWELSGRELDNEMGMRLSSLNDDIDPRPDPAAIASHRRFLGKVVVAVKRLIMRVTAFYTHSVLEKQRRFNEQLVAFHLATFIRLRRNEEQLNALREQLKTAEEDRQLLTEQLENLQQRDKAE